MKPIAKFIAAKYSASLSFVNADRCIDLARTLDLTPEERGKFKRWALVSKTRGMLLYDRTLLYIEKAGEDEWYELVEDIIRRNEDY